MSEVLVVPNAMVAEMVAYQRVRLVDDTPFWQLGVVDWRGHELPLVSFDSVCGAHVGEEAVKVQFIVMHTFARAIRLPYYGLRIKGIPRFEFVDRNKIMPALEQNDRCEYVASRVFVNGGSGFIPDFDRLEKLVYSDSLPKNR